MTAGPSMLRLPTILFAFAAAAPLLLSCKGSATADAKASSSGEAEVDFDSSKKRDEAWESEAFASETSSAPSAAPASGEPGKPTTMLGARHDLTLTGQRTPACQCLAVVAGDATKAGLAWSGPTPQIDQKTQLVVALSSEQLPCPVQAPQASYMGYEVREANVVLQVEAAVAGRPLTQGAVVPRPMTGGKLLVESPGSLPYGKAASGQGPCVIPF